MAATLALAWGAATHAQSAPASDTKTIVKEDAKTVGHAVAHSARAVGHKTAEGTRKVRDTIRDHSKTAGHAVAHSAKTVGKTVKATVTRKSDEPQPKN